MSLTKSTVFLLVISSLVLAQFNTEGGNVTNLEIQKHFSSSKWAGFFGEVTLGVGVSYIVSANGNNVTSLNVIAEQPPCDYSSINMHIIAINNTNLTPSLVPGNISILDNLIGNSSENGSNTFTLTESFTLTSGTYPVIPTTYTYSGNESSASFREGYFNDGSGNLVFVTDIVSDKPDWNSSTSDYQIMLPTNGSGGNYTIWADVAYSCATPPEEEEGFIHKIVIEPINDYEITSGESFFVEVTVRNVGGFSEWNIDVSFSCPSGLSCESGRISNIPAGGEETILLLITAEEIGEYQVTAKARNDRVRAETDFSVVALESPEIPPPFKKREINESCEGDYECASSICSGGICVMCKTNSDCKADEFCSGSLMCIKCSCGYPFGSGCIPYDCCSESDCIDSEFCIEHACTNKELSILTFEDIIIEGEELLVKIINNKGEEVVGAEVFTDDKKTYTDQNGYSSVPAPYNGLIYAYKENYPQIGQLIPVIKRAFFKFEDNIYSGVSTLICLFDSKGMPVSDSKVKIEGNTLITGEDGCFEYTFHTPGRIPLRANKDGYYLIEDAELVVGLNMCRFPLVLGILEFEPATIHILWGLSIIGALINFRIGYKKFHWRKLIGAAYAFIPLILALPNTWILTICFMSNVILIQIIIEVMILVRLARRKRDKSS